MHGQPHIRFWSLFQYVHSTLSSFLVVVSITVRLETRSRPPSSEHCCDNSVVGILFLWHPCHRSFRGISRRHSRQCLANSDTPNLATDLHIRLRLTCWSIDLPISSVILLHKPVARIRMVSCMSFSETNQLLTLFGKKEINERVIMKCIGRDTGVELS